MKTLGVIGGLGAESTAHFYLEIISAWQQQQTASRPSIIIDSIPISYFAEELEIKNGIYIEEFPKLLVNSARRLESAGAQILALPCNSAHLYFHEVQAAIDIPLVNIVSESIKFLKSRNIDVVSVLSSLITRQNKIYASNAEVFFLNVDDEAQETINNIILNLTNGQAANEDLQKLEQVVVGIKNKNILVACCALEKIIPSKRHCNFYSTMTIYVNAIINRLLD